MQSSKNEKEKIAEKVANTVKSILLAWEDPMTKVVGEELPTRSFDDVIEFIIRTQGPSVAMQESDALMLIVEEIMKSLDSAGLYKLEVQGIRPEFNVWTPNAKKIASILKDGGPRALRNAAFEAWDNYSATRAEAF